jgi:hypothetical protein
LAYDSSDEAVLQPTDSRLRWLNREGSDGPIFLTATAPAPDDVDALFEIVSVVT